MKCSMCNRTLKSAESMAVGYGPVCYRKIMPAPPKEKQSKADDKKSFEGGDYEVPGQLSIDDYFGGD